MVVTRNGTEARYRNDADCRVTSGFPSVATPRDRHGTPRSGNLWSEVVADENGRRASAGRLRRWLATFALFRVIDREQRVGLDAEAPNAVVHTQLAWELQVLALSLADRGTAPEEAIELLGNSAGSKTIELRRAAAAIRMGPSISENRIPFLANQLLLAAADGRTTVDPLLPEQEKWFREVEAFESLPPEDAYRILVLRQPALEALESSLLRDLGSESVYEIQDQILDRIIDEVRSLVGPDATIEDRLCRTQVARWRAQTHMIAAVGIASDDDDG